jgi:hypothetical protein
VKYRDNCDRIGGGNDRAENKTGKDPDRGNRPQGEADDQGADDNSDNGEQEDRCHLVAELANIDVEGSFEQQCRQKHVEQRFGTKPEIAQPAHDIAEDAPRLVGEGKIGDPADRDPHQGEQHGVRNGEPLGERQQQADQPQEGSNSKYGLDRVGHGGGAENLPAAVPVHKACGISANGNPSPSIIDGRAECSISVIP